MTYTPTTALEIHTDHSTGHTHYHTQDIHTNIHTTTHRTYTLPEQRKDVGSGPRRGAVIGLVELRNGALVRVVFLLELGRLGV